jgi:hypothetical protein
MLARMYKTNLNLTQQLLLVLSLKNIPFTCYPLTVYDTSGPNSIEGRMLGLVEGDELKWIGDAQEALDMIERKTARRQDHLTIVYNDQPIINCVDAILTLFFEQLISIAVIDYRRSTGDFARLFTYVNFQILILQEICIWCKRTLSPSRSWQSG